MAKTLWVQAVPRPENLRKVVLSEADDAHPTPNHEVFIVAYEDPRVDADGEPVEPANPPIEVGDTPGVRQRIADGDLVEVSAPKAKDQTASGGLGDEISERLAAAGYDTPEAIRSASDEELLAIDGIGPATLKRIRAEYPESR